MHLKEKECFPLPREPPNLGVSRAVRCISYSYSYNKLFPKKQGYLLLRYFLRRQLKNIGPK